MSVSFLLSLGLLTSPIAAPVRRGSNIALSFGGIKIIKIVGGLGGNQCSMITCADTTIPAYVNESIPSITMPVVFNFPQNPLIPLQFDDTSVTICKEQTTASYRYIGPTNTRTTYTTNLIPIGTVNKIINQTTGQFSYTSFTANVTTGTDIFEYHLGSNCDGQVIGESIKFLNPSLSVNGPYCFHLLYSSTTVRGITTITPKNPLNIVQLKSGSQICYLP